MEIDLSDPDAMGFLQDIREKEDTKESKNEDDAVNEIEELLRKSDNHEMVDEELDLRGTGYLIIRSDRRRWSGTVRSG